MTIDIIDYETKKQPFRHNLFHYVKRFSFDSITLDLRPADRLQPLKGFLFSMSYLKSWHFE